MIKKTKRTVYIVLGVLLLIGGVVAFSYRSLILKSVLPDLENVTVAEINFRNDSVRLQLDLSIRNKGYWKVDWLHTELKVYDDTFLLMSYSNDSVLTLERNGDKTAIMYLTLPIDKIVRRIEAHSGEDSTALRLEGVITYSTFLGVMKSKVDALYTVRVPVPPEIAVTRIEYKRAETRHDYDAKCTIRIINLNPRELDLDSVSFSLTTVQFGRMDGFLPVIHVAAMDTTYITAQTKLVVQKKGLLLARIILDKDIVEYSFVLNGRLMYLTGVDATDIPITISSDGSLELYNEKKENKIALTRK